MKIIIVNQVSTAIFCLFSFLQVDLPRPKAEKEKEGGEAEGRGGRKGQDERTSDPGIEIARQEWPSEAWKAT